MNFDFDVYDLNIFADVHFATCATACCKNKIVFRSHSTGYRCNCCQRVYKRHEIPETPCPLTDFMNTVNFRKDQFQFDQEGGYDRLIHRLIDGVHGKSHIQLLAPLLSTYGYDKKTNKAKRLKDLGLREPFDVSRFNMYIFAIEEKHLNVRGYGLERDTYNYLKATVRSLNAANDSSQDVFVPIFNSRDSCHSLTNAVARALTGSDLYSLSIAQALHTELSSNAAAYRRHLGNFLTQDDWEKALRDCTHWDPISHKEYREPLHHIHLFALANLLRRPIVLLDANAGSKPNEYEGTFLPLLRPKDTCIAMNTGLKCTPFLLAWADGTHWQYVPLVPVKRTDNDQQFFLPRNMLPPVWSAENQENAINDYLQFDSRDRCMVAAGKWFDPDYIRYMVKAYNKLQLHETMPSMDVSVLADYLDDVFKINTLRDVPKAAAECCRASEQGRLVVCVNCGRLNECAPNDIDAFAVCSRCKWIGRMRLQCVDGTVLFESNDHTFDPADQSVCPMKRKHYFQDKQYDNLPLNLSFNTQFHGTRVQDELLWFYGDSNEALNTKLEEAARKLLEKHAPGQLQYADVVRDATDKVSACVASVLEKESTKQQPTLLEQLRKIFTDFTKPITENFHETIQLDDYPPQPTDVIPLHELYADYEREVRGKIEKLAKDVAERMANAPEHGKNQMYDQVEKNFLDVLKTLLLDDDATPKGTGIAFSTPYLFKPNGIFYLYARRRGWLKENGKPFSLPLLATVLFTYSSQYDRIQVYAPDLDRSFFVGPLTTAFVLAVLKRKTALAEK